MDTAAYAQELARRLTQAGAGNFHALGETVLLDGIAEGEKVLRVVSAGSGRTEQVMQALRRAESSLAPPVIVGRRFSEKAIAELNQADANYMDDRNLKIRLSAPAMLIRLQDEATPPAEAPRKTLRLSSAAGRWRIWQLRVTCRSALPRTRWWLWRPPACSSARDSVRPPAGA